MRGLYAPSHLTISLEDSKDAFTLEAPGTIPASAKTAERERHPRKMAVTFLTSLPKEDSFWFATGEFIT